MSNECEYCLGSGYSDPDLKVICGVCGGKTEWYKSGKTGFLVVVSHEDETLNINNKKCFLDIFESHGDTSFSGIESEIIDIYFCKTAPWTYARPATKEDFILYEDLK